MVKCHGVRIISLLIIRRSLQHFCIASLHDKVILIWVYTPKFKHGTYSVKKNSQFPLHMWVGSKTLDLPLDHFFAFFDWRGLFSAALPPFDHNKNNEMKKNKFVWSLVFSLVYLSLKLTNHVYQKIYMHIHMHSIK